MKLTDFQQAALMFLAFALVPVGAWFGLGAQFDHASIALLGSGVIGGILAFIKEISGGVASSPTPTVAENIAAVQALLEKVQVNVTPATPVSPIVGYVAADGKTVTQNP